MDRLVEQSEPFYLNPTSGEMYQWQRSGRCMWCGGKCPGDQCRLRNCTSCTRLWISDTLADVSDGYQVTKEYCPPCRVWISSYHGTIDGDINGPRTLCGSKNEPDIKVAGIAVVTCVECLAAWNNLHLTHKPVLFAAPGDSI